MTTSVLHLPTPDLSSGSPPNTSTNQAKSTTTQPGLPSPTLSETSDYQRSTPSPNAGNHVDHEDDPIDWSQEKPTRRKSTSSLNSSSSSSKISNNLVLQQLRVALKKLPNNSKLKPMEALKRRHSDCGLIEAAISQKVAKVETPSKQGKITEYLPEMKHFIALRKEKLDRVLNLSSAASSTPASISNSPCKSDLDLKSSLDESDISNSSPSKKLMNSNNVESGVETGLSSNDTASVASSGSRSSGIGSCHRDEDVFEVPRTIRFPPAAPTKCYSEVVICKWELCGNEFDSTGKLLDHLKTIHAVADNQKEETDNNSSNPENPDSNSIQYKCLWEGCKVYGKGSSSKLWLEKHVMSHGGNKPFQCIVDGCKHRFGTQVRVVLFTYFFPPKTFEKPAKSRSQNKNFNNSWIWRVNDLLGKTNNLNNFFFVITESVRASRQQPFQEQGIEFEFCVITVRTLDGGRPQFQRGNF